MHRGGNSGRQLVVSFFGVGCLRVLRLLADRATIASSIENMHVSGKFALVMGAARGIGEAISSKLLESGAAGVSDAGALSYRSNSHAA